MEFCEYCGSRLLPKRVNSGKQALIMMGCTQCEFQKQESNAKAVISTRIIEHNPKQFVAVISKEEQLSILPTLHIDCP
jgi:DNA-directed RNA polymerase subunit M/transcription elongation factor TFIIS